MKASQTITLATVLLLLYFPPDMVFVVHSFAPLAAPPALGGRQPMRTGSSSWALHVATDDRRSPHGRSFSLQPSSSSRFPPILSGQSLAHNLHEMALGVLINSNGQNVLSKQTLSVSKLKDETVKHSTLQQRSVRNVERFERIPMWPTRNGLRFKAISRINPDLATRMEHKYGGAHCPNLFLPFAKQTSPFLMMCHHNHSFDLNDPLRSLQKNFVPEGFPSHAHRGMTSVTICLRGGMVHRDSLGNKQIFGSDESSASSGNPYKGKHTQWLTFGKGIVHELMWDNEPNRKGQHGRKANDSVIHQEIYQIWIDLPQSKRYMEPRVELLYDGEDTPTTIDENGTQTTIIAGYYDGITASVDTISDLAIFRVEIVNSYQTWTYEAPASHSTIIIYTRTGSIYVGGTRIPPHCTAYLSSNGKHATVQSDESGADFLVMAGEPLNQNVAAKGSMVVETHAELERAFVDYEEGSMGIPWSEGSTDEDWRRHLKKRVVVNG